MKGGLVMGIKKLNIGNNYILYDETNAGKRNSCNQIIKSWNNRVHYILEDNENETQGLRSAQLGAIFSIRAHWTVSSEPATVVMPTGERVIIVMGAINVLKSRVSGTLVNIIHALLRVIKV